MVTAASAMPAAPAASATDRTPSESRVDRDSHFNGHYHTRQNLRIEGVAEGEIECEGTLTVVEGARVKAKVTATAITIAGELEGEVICRDVFQIMPTGEVKATVSARRLTVQEGGMFNGVFHMITGEGVGPGSTSVVDKRSAPRREARPRSATESPTAEELSSDDWWAKMMGESSGDKGNRNP